MSRVLYVKHVLTDQLPYYLDAGWEAIGARTFGAGTVSHTICWEGEGEPVVPDIKTELA